MRAVGCSCMSGRDVLRTCRACGLLQSDVSRYDGAVGVELELADHLLATAFL